MSEKKDPKNSKKFKLVQKTKKMEQSRVKPQEQKKTILYDPTKRTQSRFHQSSQKTFPILVMVMVGLLGIASFAVMVYAQNLHGGVKTEESTQNSRQVTLKSREKEVVPSIPEGKTTQTTNSLTVNETSSSTEETSPPKSSSEEVKEEQKNNDYTVLVGDTLSGISAKTGFSIAQLKAFNHLTEDLVTPGQMLQLSQRETEVRGATQEGVYVVQNGDTLFSIAQRNGVTVEDLRLANALNTSEVFPGQNLKIQNMGSRSSNPSSAGTAERSAHYYIVQAGDNLYRIALNNGLTVEELQRLNGLTDYSIRAGQQLKFQ